MIFDTPWIQPAMGLNAVTLLQLRLMRDDQDHSDAALNTARGHVVDLMSLSHIIGALQAPT